MERIKDKVGVEKVPEEMPKGKKDDGLDMDEDMMMTGMPMFENEFYKIVQDIMKNRF